MEVLYRGFDGLDASFRGHISQDLCEALDEAKQKAQETRQESYLEWNGIKMSVAETGAKGGYAYRMSTGPFGAIWFFKKPNGGDPWGIRVSCRSFNLAVNGLGYARAELYRTLSLLGAAISVAGESISRIDYAVDFLAPGLVLSPEHFVMHSNANRADHIELAEMTANGKSGRVTSVTVGKMPGRQVIVYDKRAEVIAKHKPGWWEIWNAARANVDRPPLIVEDSSQSRIWRVELRAGKRHLKDRWNIVSWADLHDRLGDMLATMLDVIRCAHPNQDSNRSRWPDSELWKQVRSELHADLFEMRTFADPDLVKRVQREEHDRLLAAQMTGLLTTRAALNGKVASELPSYAIDIGEEMAAYIVSARPRFERKLEHAKDRYSLGAAS